MPPPLGLYRVKRLAVSYLFRLLNTERQNLINVSLLHSDAHYKNPHQNYLYLDSDKLDY